MWLRNRQRFDLQVWRRRHYVVEDTVTGQVVAYGGVEEGPQPGAFRVFVVMDPERLIGGTGQHLYDRLRADLGELGACAAWVREEAQDLPLLSFFAEQGFVETRRAILADGMDFVVMELRLLGDLS